MSPIYRSIQNTFSTKILILGKAMTFVFGFLSIGVFQWGCKSIALALYLEMYWLKYPDLVKQSLHFLKGLYIIYKRHLKYPLVLCGPPYMTVWTIAKNLTENLSIAIIFKVGLIFIFWWFLFFIFYFFLTFTKAHTSRNKPHKLIKQHGLVAFVIVEHTTLVLWGLRNGLVLPIWQPSWI